MQDELSREVVSMFFKDSGKRIRLSNLIVLQEHSSNDGNVYLAREQWDVDYSKTFGYLFHMSGAGGDEKIKVSGLYHVTATTVANKLLGKPLNALVPPRIVEEEAQWVGTNRRNTKEIRERNRTRQLFKLPKAIDLSDGEDVLGWLHANGMETDSVWCSTCRDFFPGNDGWNLCEHCWWCDKTGDYSTPDSRCSCKGREACSREDEENG